MTAPCPFQFLIHCEGTRFTEKKHQISMQVAQAKGLPSLKYHLLPRTKGFAVTVRSLRNVGKDDPGPRLLLQPGSRPRIPDVCPSRRWLCAGRAMGTRMACAHLVSQGQAPGVRGVAAACTCKHTHS